MADPFDVLPRTGLPIPADVEAAALDRTRPFRRGLRHIVTLVGGTRFSALADIVVTGTKTLLRPADETRVALVATNNSGATAVRIGGASVTTTQGVRLGPGGSIRVTAATEIYAISEGANVTMSMSEELL